MGPGVMVLTDSGGHGGAVAQSKREHQQQDQEPGHGDEITSPSTEMQGCPSGLNPHPPQSTFSCAKLKIRASRHSPSASSLHN